MKAELREVPWRGATVYTGIWKQPVAGPRMARRLNGDGQGALAGTAASTARRTGVCHTCETGLVSGAVTYPRPLDQPADGNTLVCCARPNGDLVLDL